MERSSFCRNLKNKSALSAYPLFNYTNPAVSYEDLWTVRYTSFFPTDNKLLKCETFNPNAEMKPVLTGMVCMLCIKVSAQYIDYSNHIFETSLIWI